MVDAFGEILGLMNNFLQSVLLACLLQASFFLSSSLAYAAELKVVDTTGLVRSARVVQDDGEVEVAFIGDTHSGIICTLKNVDGLAPDRSVPASPAHTCVFPGVPAGTWQLSTSKPSKWQVRIFGDR